MKLKKTCCISVLLTEYDQIICKNKVHIPERPAIINVVPIDLSRTVVQPISSPKERHTVLDIRSYKHISLLCPQLFHLCRSSSKNTGWHHNVSIHHFPNSLFIIAFSFRETWP